VSISDVGRLEQFERENAKLKKLLAEAMLDVAVLKDITSRKWFRLPLGKPR
jgi:putative transposase